ncbi:hypothetical protein Tco_0709924 [Tanacetum coccineum]
MTEVVEEEDGEWIRFLGGNSVSGIKKYRGLNSSDGGNIGDRVKIAGGVIGSGDEIGTDISKITRKPSKTGKHGHGKWKSTREPKIQSQSQRKSTSVNYSSSKWSCFNEDEIAFLADPGLPDIQTLRHHDGSHGQSLMEWASALMRLLKNEPLHSYHWARWGFEHKRVTKLVDENEHLKQTYKQLYDSIKPKRVQSKEQCDALSKQNLKKQDNSDYVCINRDDCMSSDNLCISNSMNDVKFRAKPKKNKSKKHIWKPTGKVFTQIGYIWKPTGRTFTIVRNACPLTRITTTNEVPSRKPIVLDSESPKPVVKLERIKRTKRSKTSQQPTRNGRVKKKSEETAKDQSRISRYSKKGSQKPK